MIWDGVFYFCEGVFGRFLGTCTHRKHRHGVLLQRIGLRARIPLGKLSDDWTLLDYKLGPSGGRESLLGGNW